jgi:hypothetical protein
MLNMSVARTKWRSKKYHAADHGIEFKLSFEEYASLLTESGITADDIGRGAEKYCLARHMDEGPYEVGNCRFVTNRQNGIEGTETRMRRGDGMPGGSNFVGVSHWNHKGLVVTPWGEFESLRKAAKGDGALWGHNKIKNLIHSGEDGYYYST